MKLKMTVEWRWVTHLHLFFFAVSVFLYKTVPVLYIGAFLFHLHYLFGNFEFYSITAKLLIFGFQWCRFFWSSVLEIVLLSGQRIQCG